MIKTVLTYPNDKDILTKESELVSTEEIFTEDFKNLIQDLKDTLKSHEFGVGISAVQIGVLKRVCVILYNGIEYTLINPIITRTRGNISSIEGCLSAPGPIKEVERFQKVWCEYLDENGNKKRIEQGGLMSIIIQHELEHFEGKCKLFED